MAKRSFFGISIFEKEGKRKETWPVVLYFLPLT